MKDSFSEAQLRDRVYSRYVADKMVLVREYDERAYERWSRNTHRQIRRWLPENPTARILDAGCGHGNLLHLLVRAGYRTIEGVDRSAEQVTLASRITEQVTCADVFEYLGERENVFDLVLAFDLIEHFTKPEVVEFLDLAFRVLRPGGSIIVQTPNADSPWCSSERYNDITHEIAFNPHSLEHLLRLAGFVDCQAREAGPVVHGAASAMRWVTWQVIRIVLSVWNLAETGTSRGGIYTRVFRARATKP